MLIRNLILKYWSKYEMDSEKLEKYTSSITLSDMEIFVFPELMYSIVLANIMSPVIWQWRELDCFKKLEGKGSYKKLMRLKQFIMDEFDFNLDLETWGLTKQQTEINRFKNFISPEEIAKSNALFGYQGDKYYFDVDIRRHFGLDKYDGDIIPYWKTETVEAMDAFRLKAGYNKAAGECVSLAALYAAAAFIVCEIPLDDIYMILTPLHSQNFIDLQDGVLTNNRRLVTKTMWFNGTEITEKAQRALRNENVTIVAHNSGYVHCLYEDATIDKKIYQKFREKLDSYLSTELTISVFANFLRSNNKYQKYFQVCRNCHNQPEFIEAEILFHYEHGSNFRIADQTFDKLLAEVSEEDFVRSEIPGRIRCDELNKFFEKKKSDLRKEEDRKLFQKVLEKVIPDTKKFVEEVADFVYIKAKLPDSDKKYIPSNPIKISPNQSRQQIIEYLSKIRDTNTIADLAFYAYRDMKSCDWLPFVKAAIERNPVSIEMTKDMSIEKVYNWLGQMKNESIYDSCRLAQPDEVTNYKSGDGLEKAFLLANVIQKKEPQQDIEIIVAQDNVTVKAGGKYNFISTKNMKKHVFVSSQGDYKVYET
jgi:hypothetical protein